MGRQIEWPFVHVPLSPEQQNWVIQPLRCAGLEMDEICALLFRFSFEAIVGEGSGTVVGVLNVVSGQSAEVRAAWGETIGRMIMLHAPADERHR